MERRGKIISFLLFLCFGCASAFAQVDLTPSDSIPTIPLTTDTLVVDTLSTDSTDAESDETYIHFDEDTLYWGSRTGNVQNLFTRLDQLLTTKQGDLHIVQIGGSHIQAGTMSHRIRKHLLDEYGASPASRGMIFPYSTAANCNNPHDYRVSKDKTFNLIRNVYQNYTFPLGASGIAVWNANEMNSITIKMNDSEHDFTADTIILLGSTRGWPIDPILKEDTIYHFPDHEDTVNGRYYFFFDHPVRDFTLYFPCSQGDTFIVNGILLKNSLPGITYTSIGVNGAQVTSYLRCQNFVRDMKLLQPDLVIFNIGVNDAYGAGFDSIGFKNNYLKLVQKIREANPNCSFIFFSNNDTWKRARKGYYVNPTGPEVKDVMFRLADLTGGAVWDQFSIMGGLKSMETWRRKGLAQKDHVHFTAAGYNLIGDLFYDAFIREIRPNTNDAR
ncbi:MAG: GDSL-type esterase/lipase family protein [Bacteroidales bacterium]|nr:GDSL-type esterase/lipase family protein [Bacteroidales bacterium]